MNSWSYRPRRRRVSGLERQHTTSGAAWGAAACRSNRRPCSAGGGAGGASDGRRRASPHTFALLISRGGRCSAHSPTFTHDNDAGPALSGTGSRQPRLGRVQACSNGPRRAGPDPSSSVAKRGTLVTPPPPSPSRSRAVPPARGAGGPLHTYTPFTARKRAAGTLIPTATKTRARARTHARTRTRAHPHTHPHTSNTRAPRARPHTHTNAASSPLHSPTQPGAGATQPRAGAGGRSGPRAISAKDAASRMRRKDLPPPENIYQLFINVYLHYVV